MTPLVRELAALDEDVALSCVWFDMGLVRSYAFAKRDGLDRLPFDKCAICGLDGKGGKFLLIADQVGEDAILLAGWGLLPDRWIRVPLFAVKTGAGLEVAQIEGEPPVTREQAAPQVGILAAFLRGVHPVGYRAEAKSNSPTNRRRAKKGKPPLSYDWHTVAIVPPQFRREPLGGTHASPRQHERRGHWRVCASGQRVWVRNCTVGDPARGYVGKDYRVLTGENR